MLPKFSVVIPCFNNAETLGRAIDSVLGQDYSVHEVIVIDDGSTDATPEIVASYSGRVIYYRQCNAGVSAARNRGVDVATGEWIAFLDADDTYASDRISAHAYWILKAPDLDLLLADQEVRDADGRLLRTFINSTTAGRKLLSRLPKSQNQYLGVEDFEDLIADGYMEVRTISLRRETFIALGGFPVDYKIGEDLHFFIRLLTVSNCAGVVMKPLATYYIYPSSALRKDPLLAQYRFFECIDSLFRELGNATPAVVRGVSKKRRACRLSLAYALLREGKRLAAIKVVVPMVMESPSWQSIRDVISIVRGF